MHDLPQLWLPVLVAAVAVFIASSLIHMVLKWHHSDYRQLANEDEVQAALRAGSPAPGQYVLPWCPGMKEMDSEAMKQKFAQGPVGFITVRSNGIYAGGSVQNGIWMGKPWSSVFNDLLDGLIYGTVTALAFLWLWP